MIKWQYREYSVERRIKVGRQVSPNKLIKKSGVYYYVDQTDIINHVNYQTL